MFNTSKNINLRVSTILILLLFAIMIVVNFLANYLPINGQTTAQLSNNYPNLFTPAGITFSIWGIIYLLIFIFLFFEVRKTFFLKNLNPNRINYHLAFAVSCILNSLWIISWHHNLIFASVLIMILLLMSLIYIYKIIRKIQFSNSIEKFFTKTTFSIYLAWICVASIANVTILFKSIGIETLLIPESLWTIIMLLAITALSLFILFKLNDIAFSVVAIWAICGIIINRLSDEIIYLNIIISALILILILIFAILIKILLPKTLRDE